MDKKTEKQVNTQLNSHIYKDNLNKKGTILLTTNQEAQGEFYKQ